MHVNRRFLYAGTFLLALGAVLVVADLGAFGAGTLTDLARLWPLTLVAVGAAIVVRRTQYGVAGGILAAALPGLVLGGAFTAIPRLPTDCASRTETVPIASEVGRFTDAATVALTTSCGYLTVGVVEGDEWSFQAAGTVARQPAITSTGTSLAIDTGAHDQWPPLDAGRSTWDLRLPTRELEQLSVTTFTGEGGVDLTGAAIGRLALTANASDLTVNASSARISTLDVAINVGAASIDLPAASDLAGSLRVGGGELKLCAPSELGLRVTLRGQPREVAIEDHEDEPPDWPGDLDETSVWQSANYESATHHADLRVSANFGAVKINPIGGCR